MNTTKHDTLTQYCFESALKLQTERFSLFNFYSFLFNTATLLAYICRTRLCISLSQMIF